jgi:type II secretory ATPase GspE/PulE/Tfp pilus assembly ATPase PilB-like protein
MHALLAHLTLPERRIWTAEERIDLLQPELRQVEINPALWGYTQALQAFRQADADIIMLDDLREPGAAREAVELAQSGRLVIAGLPGRSAAEALARLIESSGVSPHDLADALCGVHAQQLLRRICSHCRMSRAAKDSEVQEWLDAALPHVPGEAPPPAVVDAQQRDWVERYGRDGRLRRYHSPGCPRCNHSGYRSRSAVHELLLPSADLRRLIRASAPAWHLQRQAVRDGLRSLHQDALEKMLAGITTHDEVRSVARD